MGREDRTHCPHCKRRIKWLGRLASPRNNLARVTLAKVRAPRALLKMGIESRRSVRRNRPYAAQKVSQAPAYLPVACRSPGTFLSELP